MAPFFIGAGGQELVKVVDRVREANSFSQASISIIVLSFSEKCDLR